MNENNPTPTPTSEDVPMSTPPQDAIKDAPKETTNEPSNNDKIDMLLNKIASMETKINTPPMQPIKQKTKRQATAKQLENLQKAREKRNANMQLRKELKQNNKIQEKKLINEQLEKIKSEPLPKEDEPETNNNPIPDPEPPQPDPKPQVVNNKTYNDFVEENDRIVRQTRKTKSVNMQNVTSNTKLRNIRYADSK